MFFCKSEATEALGISLRRLRLKVFLIALLFACQACVLFQPISEPTERILRRGSCIGLNIPPITITTEQTALERQLLGEEVQIEPNGWLLSSSQSIGHASGRTEGREGIGERAAKSDLNLLRRYYVERGILEYYKKTLSYYRNNQIVGEGFDGKVRLVPFYLSQKGNEEERNLAKQLIPELNSSRIWLYNYYLKKEKEQSKIVEIRKKYLISYFEEAKKRIDEWIYTADQKWLRTL